MTARYPHTEYSTNVLRNNQLANSVCLFCLVPDCDRGRILTTYWYQFVIYKTKVHHYKNWTKIKKSKRPSKNLHAS